MTTRRGAGEGPAGQPVRQGPAPGGSLARVAVAVAAAAVPLALAAGAEHPERAAETAYLAVVAAPLLMVLAALPPRHRRSTDPLPGAALLTALALLALPLGPVRGATVVVLLTLATALAAAPRLGDRAERWSDEVALLLPLAVAAQVLFRSGGFLAPPLDLHTLVVVAAMPVVTAAAGALLAVRHGRTPVLVAAAAAMVLAGGFHVGSTLAMVAPAAGEVLARPPGRRRTGWRIGALLALLAPFAWQQRTAALALLVGLAATALAAAWRPQARAPRAVAASAAVTAAALGAALAFPLRGWSDAGPALAVSAVVLPLLPWSLLRDARRPSRLAVSLAGVALAVAAARCAPDLSALALPLALLALTVTRPAGDGPTQGGATPGVALQASWSAGLTLVAAVLAAYPWLRPRPAEAALDLLRVDAAGWSGLGLVVAVTAAALVLGPVTAPPALRRAALPVVLGAVLLHAIPQAPPPRPLVAATAVELDARRPVFELELDGDGADAPPPPVAGLVAHCHLSYATPLADGTPVFDLLLFADGEEPVVRWTFRAGVETGEWAARRPDVAAALGHRPPAHRYVWVAPGGRFFGQTYQSRLELPRAVAPRRLVLRRRPGLPPAVRVHLERLEATP